MQVSCSNPYNYVTVLSKLCFFMARVTHKNILQNGTMKIRLAKLVKSTSAGQSITCQSLFLLPQHEVTTNIYYSPLNGLLVHPRAIICISFTGRYSF